MNPEIRAYHAAREIAEREICDMLQVEIEGNLKKAESKIWHGHPVWFLDGNPIVGYSKLKNCIQLLFWSGQSFSEKGLKKTGSFKAAEARFTSSGQVDKKELKRWLKKAGEIQWDYKNIVKRKGKLEPLKGLGAESTPKKNSPYGSEKFNSIAEYHASFPAEIQKILEAMRTTIRKAAPEAKEVISYNMPAFKMNTVLVYYAANKEHIGFYPTPAPILFFKDALAKYKTSKGAIQFPIDKALPLPLIRKIVKFRIEEDMEKARAKKTKKG